MHGAHGPGGVDAIVADDDNVRLRKQPVNAGDPGMEESAMKRILALMFIGAAFWPLAAAPAEWRTRPLSEIAIYPEYRAPAQVVALNEARIATELPGRIEFLPWRVGQSVPKGAELLRLDAAAYRIEAERAAAHVELVANRLKLAETQLEQTRSLAQRQFVSPDGLRIKETELAVLRSELGAARQALAAARLQVERTAVRAPFAGVVRERLASVGDMAAPGIPLLVFAGSADSEVHARVPAVQVASLQAAGEWSLVAGGKTFALTLQRVSPVVNAAGQAQDAVFKAEGAPAPGVAGEVRWRTRVAFLPAGYVQQRDGALGAYVEREGQAVFVPLPFAQAGRAVPVEWPLSTPVVDEGRFALGLKAPPAAGAAQ